MFNVDVSYIVWAPSGGHSDIEERFDTYEAAKKWAMENVSPYYCIYVKTMMCIEEGEGFKNDKHNK